MIQGIGVDIVDKRRVEGAVRRWGDRFTGRILTGDEQSACSTKADRIGCIAARFAAKEALLKAIGTGLISGMSWKDMEVVSGPDGKPDLVSRGGIGCRLKDCRVHLSLSHEKDHAVAFVVIERNLP
ncbi:holo-ACP synthase [bacterium]|nr:holo-ACP synthase [bacterium]